MTPERMRTLAQFIRSQAALTDNHPHVPGPGSVRLNNEEALLCAHALENDARPQFAERVRPWMRDTFGEVIAGDKVERNHRFLEESLELVQAAGCTKGEALELVEYVYARPVGELWQEVGGVMVTLAALCLANDVNLDVAAETELRRIWQNIDKIRAKQAAKPKHSPLPGPTSPPSREQHAAAVRLGFAQFGSPCCSNERRNMNGGCDNCGDPCL
jgi:hypothetical protein